jgi:hypothetical protein
MDKKKELFMDTISENTLKALWESDRDAQNEAYYAVIEASYKPVTWAYELWDELLENLSHKDNHNRAIAAQLLCNLAKSDPEKRILRDFDSLLNVTRDERFVTARHCMQALWKVGLAGEEQQEKYLNGLSLRFAECISEKNCTLIRSDIQESLRNVYDVSKDESLKEKALALIESEEDAKYRKKYAAIWKK